jgi:hypothetical protein
MKSRTLRADGGGLVAMHIAAAVVVILPPLFAFD